MTRTGGAVASYEETGDGGDGDGEQIVVLSATARAWLRKRLMRGDRRHDHARGRNRIARRWRCSARLSHRAHLAPPQRWSSRCFAIRRPRPTKRVGRSQHKRVCAVLPVAAAVAAALAPPRPADEISLAGRRSRRRDPDHRHPGAADGRPASVGRRRRDLGEAPRVEILDCSTRRLRGRRCISTLPAATGLEVDESADRGCRAGWAPG